jgi:hypothetical protein
MKSRMCCTFGFLLASCVSVLSVFM